jgi:hypothetical protein
MKEKTEKARREKGGILIDREDLSVPSIQLIVLGLSSIYFSPKKKLNKKAFPAHLHPLSLTRHDYFSHQAIMLILSQTFLLFLEKKGKEGMKKEKGMNTVEHKVMS